MTVTALSAAVKFFNKISVDLKIVMMYNSGEKVIHFGGLFYETLL